MNELIVESSGPKRMTSLEISELVESRHDKVKQSIERLASRGTIELPPMGEVKNHLGQSVSVYQLDKRSSLIVVAQLSPEFTARIVDRWQELENKAAQTAFQLPDFTNPALAARAWADEVEQKQQLQITLQEQAPKVALATAIEASTKSIKIGDFVKVISSQTGFVIGRNNFFEWLRFDGILDRKNMPFQTFIDNGWFEVRESTYENKNTNGPQVTFTTLVTGKGQLSLFNRFKNSETFKKFLNKCALANSASKANSAGGNQMVIC
jgi:anti-repressor protein